jgi:hypothetical protein
VNYTATPILIIANMIFFPTSASGDGESFQVTENDDEITIETDALHAKIRKRGYVSGVAGGSLVDKKTGAHDLGYGLDIVDWLMEPGSDQAYRDQLPDDLRYEYDNLEHGKRPKRMIEGPQICTQAKEIDATIIRATDFVAVKMQTTYTIAPPGKKTGSKWSQTIVFPRGKRYFLSSDRIDAVNSSEAMFLRIDMPGHVRHEQGDTFSEIFLSYRGQIPSSEFFEDFSPDTKFNYRRDHALEKTGQTPQRFIRGYRLRDSNSGKDGPWLAGLTLDASLVHEAWCHQRGYVCMIQEFGGRRIEAGQHFGAAFVVGFFDSIDEMNEVYDQYQGTTGIEVSDDRWKLVK